MYDIARILILSVGIWTIGTRSTCAWESDVHFGLTKWLALKAGYSEKQATWIAAGNQGIDLSSVTEPVHTTIRSACLGNDDTGSRKVHDHHFPSEHSVPNEPSKRIVTPGYVQQRGSQQFPPRINDYADEARFKELGAFLHALQDSWSHQGEPDFPQPECHSRLGWGHAFARGGWPCHLADLTYRWHDTDVPAMAKVTYEVLLNQKPGSAKFWDELRPAIDAFASGRSKWQKDQWFAQEGLLDRWFLEEISLPDCALDAGPCPGLYPFKYLMESWRVVVARQSQTPGGVADTAPDVVTLFREFVSGVVSQNRSNWASLIDRQLAEIAMARAFRVNTSCKALYSALEPIVLGRGFARGRVTPTGLCELASQVAKAGASDISCQQAVDAVLNVLPEPPGPSLELMAQVANSMGLPTFVFSATFHPPSESFVAMVRFVHLQRKTLMLTARRVTGTARIVGIAWIPDQ